MVTSKHMVLTYGLHIKYRHMLWFTYGLDKDTMKNISFLSNITIIYVNHILNMVSTRFAKA